MCLSRNAIQCDDVLKQLIAMFSALTMKLFDNFSLKKVKFLTISNAPGMKQPVADSLTHTEIYDDFHQH